MPRLVHVTTVPDALLFLRGQVGFMKRRGYVITAISSPGEGLDAFGREEEIDVIGVSMARRITPLADFRALVRLVRVLRRIRPDIVHAHTPKGGLLGISAAFLARVPVRIYHMRGLPLTTATGVRRSLLRVTEMIACRLATRVLCVGHSLRRLAIEEGLVAADRITVLGAGSGNGVDAEGRFSPDRLPEDARKRVRAALGVSSEATVFTFVGRLVRDKGIHELGSAWREVRREIPDARLLLVGKAEEQDPVPEADRIVLQNDPSVLPLGFVQDPAALYAASDVVVLPTYREGFPNVVLEAAAMELPTIATRVVGCVDAVLHGITGTLVPARDARALARAMIAYARDPELRVRHGQAGRRRVLQEFAREHIWRELARVYDEELGTRSPRSTEMNVEPSGMPATG